MNKIILFGIVFSMMVLPATAMAENIPSPHLSVIGQGTVTVEPNMATFTVAISSKQRTAVEAKENADKAVGNLLSSLMADGIEKADIQSANLSIYPQYTYPKNGKRILSGYQGSRNVTITVNHLDKLNTYLNTALNDGMNQVQNMVFSVKDKVKYRALAREKAVKNAKDKAASLAKGFDVTLKGIWDVHYGDNNNYPSPRMAYDLNMSSMKSVNESYQQKEIRISDTVSVTYLIQN
jgi:hypothetical protein